MAMPSHKQIFDRDGYVVIGDLLTPDQKRQLTTNLDRYIKDVVPTVDREFLFYEDKSDLRTLIRAEHMERSDAFFQTFMEEGVCRELAESLLDGPVEPQAISLFGKAPGRGLATPPHQDGFYWMLEPNEATMLWFAIDSVDEENGCLSYVPGSHRLGLRPHAKGTQLGFSQAIADYGPEDERQEQMVCVEPGELIAHHSLCIHRAGANRSSRLRRAVGITYYAQRAKADTARSEAYARQLKEEWAHTDKL